MVALKATNQPPKRGWSYLNNTSLISKMLYFPLTMKYSTMTSNLLVLEDFLLKNFNIQEFFFPFK